MALRSCDMGAAGGGHGKQRRRGWVDARGTQHMARTLARTMPMRHTPQHQTYSPEPWALVQGPEPSPLNPPWNPQPRTPNPRRHVRAARHPLLVERDGQVIAYFYLLHCKTKRLQDYNTVNYEPITAQLASLELGTIVL